MAIDYQIAPNLSREWSDEWKGQVGHVGTCDCTVQVLSYP